MKRLDWKLMWWWIDHYEWARVLCLKIDFAVFMVKVCLVCLAGFGWCRIVTVSWSHRWELDVRCGPKVDQRLLERSSTRGAAPYLTPPTPQGNDLTCMIRHSSWSDHFSVSQSGWPRRRLVSIQLLLRWDLWNFVQRYCHYCSHSLFACSTYLWQ